MSMAMPSSGCGGPCNGVGGHDRAARLVGEQVDGVGGVVPQQVIGPAPRLAEGVRVRAPEEVRLHVHLLDRRAHRRPIAPVHPLVARVEAARVADTSRRDRCARCAATHRLAVGEVVAQRDLDLDVLAGRERGDRLFGVQRRSAWRGRRRRRRRSRAHRRGRWSRLLDAVARRRTPASGPSSRPTTATTSTPSMLPHGVDVLGAERAGAGERDRDGHAVPQITVLQDQVADGGVARRHVVEAVADGRRRAHRRGRPSRRGRSATSPARCPRSRPRGGSRRGASRRALGAAISSSRNAWSNSRLMSPARGPCSWWLMPPVPQICTSRSSSYDSTAVRIAWPR